MKKFFPSYTSNRRLPPRKNKELKKADIKKMSNLILRIEHDTKQRVPKRQNVNSWETF